MKYVGIDLHKRLLVVAFEDEWGRPGKPHHFECLDTESIRGFFETLGPFQAVIEASSSYRWLYELLGPLGTITLAHPLQLRVSGKLGAVQPMERRFSSSPGRSEMCRFPARRPRLSSLL